MKILWTGTDSLMLIDMSMRRWKKKPYWIAFRILTRIMDYFAQEHYADSEQVAYNLRQFGLNKPISVFKDRVRHPKPYRKRKHDLFNVIYYMPRYNSDQEFTCWLYGCDIIERLKTAIPYVNFIECDGTLDMSQVYPYADFCVRPNRHDGSSRMIQECIINKIPYYHSFEYPDYEKAKEQIREAYTAWQEQQ